MKDRNNNVYMPFPNQGFMPNMGFPTMPMELENKVNSLENNNSFKTIVVYYPED